MFNCIISDEKKSSFAPFTLNIRLTTEQTAKNLYKMLKPSFCELDGVKINREQRQMAGRIRDLISDKVVNVDD